MITMVKFMPNPKDSGTLNNKVITRTMGKIGVLHGPTLQQSGVQPQPEEFWFVRILKEKGAGTPQGLFLLELVEKVRLSKKFIGEPDIVHIIPGTYEEELVGNVLLVHPNVSWFPERLGPNWIVGQSIKHEMMRRHNDRDNGIFKLSSIILVFDRTNEWTMEPLRSSTPIIATNPSTSALELDKAAPPK